MTKGTKNINKDFEKVLLLIQEARNRTFSKVNAELVLLYFNVGEIVAKKVEEGNWGENTVEELANFIAANLPGMQGFNRRGLYRMKQFYETYTGPQFVTTLLSHLQIDKKGVIKFVTTVLSQIQWSAHLHILSKTKTAEEKLFYIHLTINEKLSVRELERQLNTAVFERTMLGNQVAITLPAKLPNNFFKDPYIFDFLNLPEIHSESDLEKAIIKNLQKFILEVGKGFTYMGNQYRLQVGNKDYHTDLLFYNRDLQCIVLFELKIEALHPNF